MISVALLLAAAAASAPGTWPLTVDGWGTVRIGMSRAQVEKALHIKLNGEPLDDEATCIELVPRGPDRGLWFLFEGYKLRRISIAAPSTVVTPRGIGIGAGADTVRRAYGPKLQAEPHHYEDLPSEYLTFWTVPGRRGVRFETNIKRAVQTIHAGTDAIQLIEGCA